MKSSLLSVSVKMMLSTYCLLLDTGTVSNIVPEDRRDLVQDIRDEHTSLQLERLVKLECSVNQGSSLVLELFVSPRDSSEMSSR